MSINSFNKKYISLFLLIAITGFLVAFLVSYNSESQKNSPFAIKSNKPFYQPQKLSQKTSTQGGSLFSNRLQGDTHLFKKDIKGPEQGEVTIIDWCSGTVFIGDVPFNVGSLDLTGIQTGDRVEVTYRDTNKGRVIESINVIR
ncbi:MAG: hypothetical protein ACUVUQ_06455 [Thermodesulfovibrionales bacterium]